MSAAMAPHRVARPPRDRRTKKAFTPTEKIYGGVGTHRTHSDTHRRFRHGGSIVYPVAHHGNIPEGFPHPHNEVHLALREHLRLEFIHARDGGHPLSGPVVVPRDHGYPVHSEALQFPYRIDGIRPHFIGDAHDSAHVFIAPHHHQ